MIEALIIFVGLLGFGLGYFVSAFLIARDPDVVRLNQDEVIVKKPDNGLVLIAVTQQVARRIVLQGSPVEKSVVEARDLLVD
jgi:hypothetical protein